MVEWTEKYRPRRLDDIIGNHKPRADLRRWAESWLTGTPKKRAVVLMGDPGIGKTTAALALANDMGWQVIEMNASDSRNAEAIMSIAGKGAQGETFTDEGEFMTTKDGKRKLIVLDEADNIFGREDFGGVRAIGQIILETQHPIILIVNDWYALRKRSSIIQGNALTIKFGKPSKSDITTLLRNISRKEGVEVPEEVLLKLAERSSGDVRAALKDLQSIAEGRDKLEMKNISALGDRDTSLTVFKSMEIIFQTGNCKRSRDTANNLDENPESLILWIDHNIPFAYRDPKDVHSAYEMLSRADIFLGRVRRRQNYSLWSYARDMMTCGVSLAKSREYRGHINYNFPLYLMKMSRSKGQRGIREVLGSKLARNAHTSGKRALQDILPYFKYLYNQDVEFRLSVTRRLNLTEDEVGYLLDAKPDTHHVRHVFDAMRKVDAVSRSGAAEPDEEEEKEEPKPKKRTHPEKEPTEKEEEPEEEKKDEKQQRNLFDFR
ncbi:MAG: replication factor C large subunit [Candidatus Thermoplasmatota archaeon]|nr:replication factor C large subunit [Euryarchaeota archaeon]MBU4031343.1 replication factor C large subunit [Candidatus Thermoplasmatota archaeon]MBU4071395.1 replication factor C large subunit [Candidatus Thermoplasmatota archaeon]MBU4143499.1 replication factor C large subunit [Candidatus Thermoplasmatota archaeon]MBU4591733.1 replication factor C large subunit [Candidatus Thermoplasmatota archaeon]